MDLAQALHWQHLERLSATTLRALSGDAALHYRGHRLHRGDELLPAFAPHLHPDPRHDDADSFRGAADGLALRLTHSDAALHASLRPADAVGASVFDLLEQFRVESLAPARWPGLARNLRHRFEAWLLAFHASGLTESTRGLLLFTVAQTARSRVTAEPVLELTEDMMEGTRFAMAGPVGPALAGLRAARADQGAYAAHALRIAAWVAERLRRVDGEDEGADDDEVRRDQRRRFGLRLDGQGDDAGTPSGGAAVAGAAAVDAQPYTVFTRAHDRVLDAATLARPAVLAELRDGLDRAIAQAHLPLHRLAHDLHAALARPERDGWEGDLEEGRIDGRRLTQLIASPAERRLFQQERRQPVTDAAVTLLIDCSGSMRTHMPTLSVAVDTLARALDMAGVPCEVLGFSTGAWNGGRARADWLRAGRPAQPGRLNELALLVFKDAAMPWRQARQGLAALRHETLFREGIDGEALAWATARLQARPERRRVLWVLSDGGPQDGATLQANGPHLLDAHLAQVAAVSDASVELRAWSLGLDLSGSYRHSHLIDLTSLSVLGLLRLWVGSLATGRA